MNVEVNGETCTVPEATTIEELARRLGVAPSGVAVAVNHEVVVRSAWSSTMLSEGDRVELLGAMQGG